ncbi:MAG: DsrE family protein, partial [Desulfobacterota bacterium]|nr:DsrE family protein [Thermodesulfobacteriota bacterium]
MNSCKGVLAALAILVLFSGMAAAERGEVIINLTTDDPTEAAQALGAAREALQAGDKVILFLSRDGARLATVWNPSKNKILAGKTALQFISGLIRDGAEVMICPQSMRNCRMDQYEVMYGVERM